MRTGSPKKTNASVKFNAARNAMNGIAIINANSRTPNANAEETALATLWSKEITVAAGASGANWGDGGFVDDEGFVEEGLG